MIMIDETIDDLRSYNLRVFQPVQGYRFSLDPLLLADFAGIGEGRRIIDLGTGSGIIPLLMARRCASSQIVGVEVQEEMADLAGRNVALNGLSDRVEIICADILSLRKRFPASSFDLVVANPPYRKQGTGRISPKAGRDRARHEATATLADFLEIAKYLVRPTGTIAFIYHPVRLIEFCTAAAGPEAGATATADGPREHRCRRPDGPSGTGQGEEGGSGRAAAALRLRSGRGVQR